MPRKVSERREVTVSVRVRPSELDVTSQAARADHRTLSDFIRLAAIRAATEQITKLQPMEQTA